MHARNCSQPRLGWLPRAIATACLLAATLTSTNALASGASYPSGWIDTPALDARLNGASATVTGWALDAGASTGTGIDRVDLYVDGAYASAATYGDQRPDMASAYGARFSPSGYHASLDLSHLGGGSHTLGVRAHSTVSGATTDYTRSVSVVKPLAFGANAHLMWHGLSDATNDLDRIQAAGLISVRFDLYWSSIEPNVKGQYDQAYLSKLDGVLAAARARGISPTMTVIGTPAWARGNVGSIVTPPTNPNDYADAMAMLAQRYASVPGLAYEIWNEPNQTQFWDVPGGPNPAAYTALLRAAYPRIKSVAPSANVVGGAIAFDDQAFIAAMYAAGARGNFDVLSLHPYSLAYAPDSTVSIYNSYTLALQNIHSALVNQGDRNTPVWITEDGWSTNDVSDATRAAYLQQAVNMLNSTFPFVEQFDVYALNQAEDFPDMGLTTATGAPTQSWTAYVSASRAAIAARASVSL